MENPLENPNVCQGGTWMRDQEKNKSCSYVFHLQWFQRFDGTLPKLGGYGPPPKKKENK